MKHVEERLGEKTYNKYFSLSYNYFIESEARTHEYIKVRVPSFGEPKENPRSFTLICLIFLSENYEIQWEKSGWKGRNFQTIFSYRLASYLEDIFPELPYSEKFTQLIEDMKRFQSVESLRKNCLKVLKITSSDKVKDVAALLSIAE